MSFIITNNSVFQPPLILDESLTNQNSETKVPMIIMPLELYQKIENQNKKMEHTLEKNERVFNEKIETINIQCKQMIDCNNLLLQQLTNEQKSINHLTERLNNANTEFMKLEASNEKLKTIAKVFCAATLGYVIYLSAPIISPLVMNASSHIKSAVTSLTSEQGLQVTNFL